MQELLPSAQYSAPDTTKTFEVDASALLTTNGKTTGPSDYLMKVTDGKYEDPDKPSENKDTRIGRLRAYVTSLQDDVNEFLTERMKKEKADAKKEAELEKQVLDGDDDEGEETDETK